MAGTDSTLHNALRDYIERTGRGAAAAICLNTDISASDLSNWMAGRRDLPAHKLVSAISWLMEDGRLTYSVHHKD